MGKIIKNTGQIKGKKPLELDVTSWRLYQRIDLPDEYGVLLVTQSLNVYYIRDISISNLLKLNLNMITSPYLIHDFIFKKPATLCRLCKATGVLDWIENVRKTNSYTDILSELDIKNYHIDNKAPIKKITGMFNKINEISFYVPTPILKESQTYLCEKCLGSGLLYGDIKILDIEELPLEKVLNSKEKF
jgi:hypothetical protein